MLSGIYVITNIKTKWLYIGSSKDIRARFQSWRGGFNTGAVPTSMQKDLAAGSPSDFIFKLVRECAAGARTLNANEKEILKLLEKKYPGKIYNKATPCRHHRKKVEEHDEQVRKAFLQGVCFSDAAPPTHIEPPLDVELMEAAANMKVEPKHMVDGVSAYSIAKKNGISDALLYTRINKYGWDVKRAATELPRTYPTLAPKDPRRKGCKNK